MNDMNVSDIVYGFRVIAMNQSKNFCGVKHGGDGAINYPYAFGALYAHMRLVLEELNLTDEQMIILRNRLEREQNRLYHV